MPPLVLIAVAAISVSVPLLGWSVLARPDQPHKRAVTNLQRGLQGTDTTAAGPLRDGSPGVPSASSRAG